jgi:hypothetical protein
MNSTYIMDGEVLTRTDEEEAERIADIQACASVVNVPQQIPRRKAIKVMTRKMIGNVTLLDRINTIIDGIPGQEGIDARIDFDQSLYFERDTPLIATIGAIVPLTDSEVDALFIDADALP